MNEEKTNKEIIKKFVFGLIDKKMKVTISDHRIFIGTFLCVDASKNIILGNTIEWHWKRSKEEEEAELPNSKNISEDYRSRWGQRRLGYVMIPGKHIVSCHVLSHHPILKIIEKKKEEDERK